MPVMPERQVQTAPPRILLLAESRIKTQMINPHSPGYVAIKSPNWAMPISRMYGTLCNPAKRFRDYESSQRHSFVELRSRPECAWGSAAQWGRLPKDQLRGIMCDYCASCMCVFRWALCTPHSTNVGGNVANFARYTNFTKLYLMPYATLAQTGFLVRRRKVVTWCY